MINYYSSLVHAIYDSELDPQSKKNNYNERKSDTIINSIIIHYTVLNFEDSYRVFTEERNVSVHYIIDRDGKIYQAVSEQYKAWHAGVSYWKGLDGMNEYSIGIELINHGSGDERCFPTRFDQQALEDTDCSIDYFPKDQITALINLVKDIMVRHNGNIIPEMVLGHSDIAPGRKIDPGAYFPWQDLAKNKIGIQFQNDYKNLTESVALDEQNITDILNLKNRLNKLGYKIDNQSEVFDQELSNVIRAFKMHFVPNSSFPWDVWSNICEVTLANIEEIYDLT